MLIRFVIRILNKYMPMINKFMRLFYLCPIYVKIPIPEFVIKSKVLASVDLPGHKINRIIYEKEIK